ncbi:MAG: GntR family transcriptional regulator [Bacillota bacterium]
MENINDSKVKNQSYTTQVYKKLKDSIVSLKFEPGETLVEEELADIFGTSRTPIRQAIAQLETEGFIISIPYKGKQVAPITLETFHLKVALESYSLEIIMDDLDIEDYEYLEDILNKSIEAAKKKEYRSWTKLNDQFHRYFIQKSGLTLFIDTLDNLTYHMKRIRYKFIKEFYDELSLMNDYHFKILNAIKEKDLIKAQKLLTEHTKIFLSEINEE